MKRNIKLKGHLKNYMYWPLILTILLVILNVPIYIINVKSGMVVSGFTVLYFVIVLFSYHYNKPVLVDELISFATQYGTVQKRLLDEFEVPYALLDHNGKILWCNQKFSEVTQKPKDYRKTINGILPSVTKEIIQKKGDEQNLHIKMDKQEYRIQLKKLYFDSLAPESDVVSLEENEDFLTALYIYDETEVNRYIRENSEQKLVSALVYIDNYEEVLESIEDVKRSLLIALIDRKVNKYFAQVDGLIQKIEKDKYFVVFKHKYMERLEEDKFSVIEEVKTVKVGNEMAVTLSIGIGYNAGTYNQNYDYARAAIDLALGRGGDQVVIKEENQITYYGGKSQKVEKNTRVKARVKAQALRELMETREKVFVMGHKIGDIDSFGAAIGIFCAARELGKQAHIVIDEVTTSLRPLKDCFSVENGYPEDLCISSETALHKVDSHTLVMVVDTNKPEHTECPELLSKTKSIVVFDHHRQSSNVVENTILSYIEPYASSTCEMIAEMLQYFSENIKLTTQEADCIYAGILIDTNNFMTKTGVRTFEAAAYLRRSGADVTRVRKLLRNDMTAYKARAEAIRRAEVYREKFAISVCPADKNLESPTVVGAQAANELLNIIGIKASFVLTQYQDKIYVSSRSIDEINVQLIMERLGGGGHLSMAGAQLTNCSVEEAKTIIKNTLDEMIEEGDID